MRRKEVEDKVRWVLSENLGMPMEKIKSSTLLSDDLGLDSYGMLEMTSEIEDAFDIKIINPKKSFPALKTVEDAVSYIYQVICENKIPRDKD